MVPGSTWPLRRCVNAATSLCLERSTLRMSGNCGVGVVVGVGAAVAVAVAFFPRSFSFTAAAPCDKDAGENGEDSEARCDYDHEPEPAQTHLVTLPHQRLSVGIRNETNGRSRVSERSCRS